jgi:SAM-dependent methyltransferase
MKIEQRYLDDTYSKHNPNWHQEDALWKANIIDQILKKNEITPTSIAEIGCGTGDILLELSARYTNTSMLGYDISPSLRPFWESKISDKIQFIHDDFFKVNTFKYDVLLMIDVFEHVRDPFTFLENAKVFSNYFVFHIPLDLSAQGLVRNSPFLKARREVGHLHSYTKDLALETLTDSGYTIIDFSYTGSSRTMANRPLKTKLANIPRWLLSTLNKDLSFILL